MSLDCFHLNMIESFRYLPESIYNYSAIQNSLVGDLSRPASSATAFTIDFQNAFENSNYVSASLHESSNAKDPGDSLISSPLLQEYIATQNIQQETEGTNFPPNVLGSTCVDLLICRSWNFESRICITKYLFTCFSTPRNPF